MAEQPLIPELFGKDNRPEWMKRLSSVDVLSADLEGDHPGEEGTTTVPPPDKEAEEGERD